MRCGILVPLIILRFFFPPPGHQTKNASCPTKPDFPNADSLKHHVMILGSDAMEGRGTGMPGGERAAGYIARHLEKLNLEPIGDNRTYFQRIPMHGSTPLPGSRLKLFSEDKEHDFILNQDYLLYKSGAQTFIPTPVPLVFVGYGIVAPEFDHNDYQSADVEGKIAVFLSGEPPSRDSTYFQGADPTIYTFPESKQRIAISRGALGSIMIPLSGEERAKSWHQRIREFSFEDVTLAYSTTGNLSVVMNPEPARRLFENAPFSLEQILEMERSNALCSFPLRTTMSFKGEFSEREFFAPNVIGMLPGRNRGTDAGFIIVSAHYDHLGIGPPVEGDSIYNGVFDNAAGMAAVLEIARGFAGLAPCPPHSVIFLFTTGEEKGLLGSTYYTDHPVVPLHKTMANINVDGLAMFEPFRDVVGVGAELSSLGDLLTEVASGLGLSVSPIPSSFLLSESFARSDQISFAKAGVPAILIAEGIRYERTSAEAGLQRLIEWNRLFYHTPFDDLNQSMDFEAAVQHTQILFAFCLAVANLRSIPEWKPETPYTVARFRSMAEKR